MALFPKDRNLAVALDRVEIEVRASDFRVRPDEVEIRLDAFLHHHLPWRSRSSVQRLVREGQVLVAPASPERPGAPVALHQERRSGVRLRHGARVVVIIPEAERVEPVLTPPDGLVILHEDEEALAVDKPPFQPVHPSGRHLSDTLIQRVHARYRTDGAGARFPIRLCHRLDRETSGVVLLGKGERPHREMMRQFEEREIEKEYLAVVVGEPDRDEGLIDLPLGPARRSRVQLKMAVQMDASPSRTAWRVLERHGGYALLSCRPHTGRQHQIRVHLEALGHPVVGDKLYGPDDEYFLRGARDELTEEDLEQLVLPRQALHSHRLVWHSPGSGERREVVSPLAADLRSFLDGLG